MDEVWVLSVNLGLRATENQIFVYRNSPDLYELMEAIADNEPYMTFSQVKDLATHLHNDNYVSIGCHEYTISMKAVMYG